MGLTLEKYRNHIRKQIIMREIRLPMLPKAAAAVFALATDSSTNIEKITELIYRDQALAGHVLRIVNSATFAAYFEVTSIKQAVFRLGTRLLSEICLSITLQGKFYKVPGFEKEVKLLMRHSIASGQFGREVAKITGLHTEEQILCGMMHGIGKPIVLQVIYDYRRQLRLPISSKDVDLLIEEFHIPISELLATKWAMPDFLKYSMKYYKSYKKAKGFEKEVMATYLCDLLATYAVYEDKVREIDIAQDPVRRELGMDVNEIYSLIEKKHEIMEIVKVIEF